MPCVNVELTYRHGIQEHFNALIFREPSYELAGLFRARRGFAGRLRACSLAFEGLHSAGTAAYCKGTMLPT